MAVGPIGARHLLAAQPEQQNSSSLRFQRMAARPSRVKMLEMAVVSMSDRGGTPQTTDR